MKKEYLYGDDRIAQLAAFGFPTSGRVWASLHSEVPETDDQTDHEFPEMPRVKVGVAPTCFRVTKTSVGFFRSLKFDWLPKKGPEWIWLNCICIGSAESGPGKIYRRFKPDTNIGMTKLHDFKCDGLSFVVEQP